MDYQLLYYFGLWQMWVCLLAFFGLMAIWYHIGRRQGDFGQVWLALSILCWSFSGLVEAYYADQITSLAGSLGTLDATGDVSGHISSLQGFKTVLSLLNSLFILLALPWFRYMPKALESVIKNRYWPLIVGLPFVFSLLPTMSKLIFHGNVRLISELDVYYSILTLAVLGLVLWESFINRKLAALAYLSTVCILVTFAAQIFKLTDGDSQILFSAIFKTSLIMIFFALALSWVRDLDKKIAAVSSDLTLKIKSNRKGSAKDSRVEISGLTDTPVIFGMTNKNHSLLQLFAERLNGSDDDWLEIKPKSDMRTGKTYDINDYNEMKRLLVSMLDGIYGKGQWTKEQHEMPLKELLFELSSGRERKVRLAIPKSNVTIY